MRPARTEADKAWRRLVMRYRYKRLTGLTRRSIGVPSVHTTVAGQGGPRGSAGAEFSVPRTDAFNASGTSFLKRGTGCSRCLAKIKVGEALASYWPYGKLRIDVYHSLLEWRKEWQHVTANWHCTCGGVTWDRGAARGYRGGNGA